jgi:hypothetical protein
MVSKLAASFPLVVIVAQYGPDGAVLDSQGQAAVRTDHLLCCAHVCTSIKQIRNARMRVVS